MRKKDFVTLILGTVGGLMFALGLCMTLLPQWNAFKEGIVFTAVGLLVELATGLIRRKMEGKPAIQINGKIIGAVVLGIVGSLAVGLGLCMVLVWEMLVPGIVAGIVGIVLMLCIIPMLNGLSE